MAISNQRYSYIDGRNVRLNPQRANRPSQSTTDCGVCRRDRVAGSYQPSRAEKVHHKIQGWIITVSLSGFVATAATIVAHLAK